MLSYFFEKTNIKILIVYIKKKKCNYAVVLKYSYFEEYKNVPIHKIYEHG